MKKFITTLMLVVVATTLSMAQGEIVNKYFDKFANNEEFVKVSVSSKMFSLFTELEAGSPEEEEFLKAVSKLKGMKMIVGDSITNGASLYADALKEVKNGGFEELMMVRDAEENFQFSIKEKGGVISELLMVAGGKKQFIVMSIYGEIDLKNISKIARSMNVTGLQNLEKLDGSGN